MLKIPTKLIVSSVVTKNEQRLSINKLILNVQILINLCKAGKKRK
jgi:hypothetical protein